MSQMMPADLAQVLQGNSYGPQQQAPDPLSALQEVIQVLPGLMAALPDPKDVNDVARCLLVLTNIQQRMMGGQQGGGQQGGGQQSGYGGQPAAA